MKKTLLSFLLCACFLNNGARTSKGKEFWIGFMENISLSYNGSPIFKLHVSADVASTCTLSAPATGYTYTFSVAAGQVVPVTLPPGNYNPIGDEAFAQNGLRITASDSVEVKAFHFRVYFSESTLILPTQELGDEYLVIARRDEMQYSPSEFVALATQNNTILEITPSVVTLGTRPAGVSYTVVLQQGQMYQLQSMSDLTGTRVRSMDPAKKIAVFGGARQARFGFSCQGGADDHLYDQLRPVGIYGTHYHVVPFSGHQVDEVKIMALQDNSIISVTSVSVFVLNKGQSVSFSVTASCEITANHPVAVAQFATSQMCNGSPYDDTGDPGMILLTPASMQRTNAVFLFPAGFMLNNLPDYFALHRLNIVVNNASVGSVMLDNVAIPSSSFSLVSPNSNYSYTRLVLDTLGSKQHTLSCPGGFNATIYSFKNYTFYGHHLGYTHDAASLPLGFSEDRREYGLTAFPVPASERLSVKADKKFSGIAIVNILGIPVLVEATNGTNSHELDISKLPNGVYYCRIMVEGSVSGAMVRISVNH